MRRDYIHTQRFDAKSSIRRSSKRLSVVGYRAKDLNQYRPGLRKTPPISSETAQRGRQAEVVGKNHNPTFPNPMRAMGEIHKNRTNHTFPT